MTEAEGGAGGEREGGIKMIFLKNKSRDQLKSDKIRAFR